MWPRRSADPPTERDLLAIEPDVRRVVAARVGDRADVQDITQEALARAWEARWRLERRTLAGYAIVTARHLVTSEERRNKISERHAPQLADPPFDGSVEDEVVQREEHAALATALRRLDEGDRRILVAHEVDDRLTSDLARTYQTSPGAITARLARARARLRLEYLLVFRNVTLPTPRCRSVLLALATGDRRRQSALRASEHLVECPTCGGLSEALVARRRALAGVAAPPFLAWLVEWIRGRWNAQQATAVATVVGATGALLAAVGLVGLQLTQRTPEPPAAAVPVATTPPARSLVVDRAVVLPAAAVTDLSRYVRREAVATRVPVRSVPADEGFWIGWTDRARVWVQFAGAGESRVTVRKGNAVSFTGTVVAHDAAFPREVGVSGADGAAQLVEQGAHIVVTETRLTVN